MNRRGFLTLLGIAGAAVATGAATLDTFLEDPERALWVPGQKTIVDLGGGSGPEMVVQLVDQIGVDFAWSAQALGRIRLVTADMITREALRVLENNLKFVAQINREYDGKFGGGAVIGGSLNVRSR